MTDTIPFLWGIFFTPQPFESTLHSGGGWSWETLTLLPPHPPRLALASRRDCEPHFLAPPILLAPVPEAAVWVTSSRKHALFLRKWKVSEVWWGAGCLQQQLSGLPFSDSPSRRDLTGAAGAPAYLTFRFSGLKPWGIRQQGLSVQMRGGGGGTYYDRGPLQSYRLRHLVGGGRRHCCLLSTSLLPPPGLSVFPFFLPLAGKKLTSGPLRCHQLRQMLQPRLSRLV